MFQSRTVSLLILASCFPPLHSQTGQIAKSPTSVSNLRFALCWSILWNRSKQSRSTGLPRNLCVWLNHLAAGRIVQDVRELVYEIVCRHTRRTVVLGGVPQLCWPQVGLSTRCGWKFRDNDPQCRQQHLYPLPHESAAESRLKCANGSGRT